MILQLNNSCTKLPRGLIYPALVVAGILILLICSLFQHVPAPLKGEYYYSTFFRNNYTLPAKVLFFSIGFLVGYLFQMNPWLTGICLNLIFPLTSIIEASYYPGSHNLIPIEFAFHLWSALPSVIAVYIGRYVFQQVVKRKEKVEEKERN